MFLGKPQALVDFLCCRVAHSFLDLPAYGRDENSLFPSSPQFLQCSLTFSFLFFAFPTHLVCLIGSISLVDVGMSPKKQRKRGSGFKSTCPLAVLSLVLDVSTVQGYPYTCNVLTFVNHKRQALIPVVPSVQDGVRTTKDETDCLGAVLDGVDGRRLRARNIDQ